MFNELYVKNLALIDEIRVPFSNGLHVMTGETGAGKSILLGSVNLALGGKYSTDMIRHGAEYGYVELTFSVDREEQLRWLKEKDIYPDEGTLVLSRKLLEKKSICKINGETVPLSLLKEVASVLIDIHGQHEHQSLLYKKNHLTILDTFGKESVEIAQQVAADYATYKAYKTELEHADKDERERNKEIHFLEYEIKEIRDANLRPGEDEQLEDNYRMLVNGQKIVANLHEAYGYTGGDGASGELSRAIRLMQDVATYDTHLGDLYEQLVEVDSLLNDFNREVADYHRSLDFSEETFVEVEKRLNEVNHLKAKYGNSISDILSYCEKKEEELSQLENYEIYLENLGKEVEKAKQKLQQSSEQLSLLRQKNAVVLADEIKKQLRDLNFEEVKFEIVFEQLADYTAHGMDDIEFMISLNPGQPIRPLGEVASGGELSRIMLAIKTVMAKQDEIETLIFDEIDVGISGRTAQKVSEKMALIAKNHQVICITHLAQIAAMADVHYAIEKKVSEGNTRTEIKELNENEEILEIARILGGAEITQRVIENAKEMKELANRTK